ncbi:MAG TPA: hypothetical protein VF712_16850 [Thermoleophilaceae bacterium]
MTLAALIGTTALWLLYGWLLSAIVCSWLSERKGYGEQPGLASGLLLSLVAVPIWLLFPAKADSKWKIQGALPFMKGTGETVAEARARGVGEDHPR